MALPEQTTFALIPQRTLDRLLAGLDDIREIRTKLDDQTPGPQVEWISRQKFMELCNIGATTFNIMKNEDKLVLKDVGRKKYVHISCINKYFQNKL